MKQMILKKPLLDDLKGIKEVLVGQGDPILASVLNRAIACVEKQAIVDPVEVVHGRWEGHDYDLVYACSVCGYPTEYLLSEYCPRCGAKMDGDGNGNKTV